MLEKRKGLSSVALLAGLALTVAGCNSNSNSSTTGTGSGSGSSGSHRGGTLKLLGGGDVDHLDTASAYYTVSYTLLRALSRQLVSYPNSADVTKANTPVADLATSVPTPSNGGKTYTFTIRDGAAWDVKGVARQVTGADVLLGFKRLCNPVQPTGALGYYAGVIQGMKEYCDGFARVAGTIPAIKAYITGHDITGIVVNGQSVTFNLVQPAGDFLYILALPFSSPAPIESLNYLPDSPEFRQNFISDGPYTVTKYVANREWELGRNPVWKASADPLRTAYVDNISVTEGSDEGPVQQQLEAGTADLEWDTNVPTSRIPALLAAHDSKLVLADNGQITYMVINAEGTNAALKKPAVRQALNYAVNKQDIIQVVGGPTLYQPQNQILTPPLTGFVRYNPYPTPNDSGDIAKAKQLLASAGYPNGLTLTYLYRNKGKAPAIAQTLQADLQKAGITLKLKQVPSADFYTRHLQHPAATRSGDWDLATPGWNPDWQGNAARSFFVPLLDGRQCGEGSTNYACYNNPAVNHLIDQALAATDSAQVTNLWHQADQAVMADAPWVPLYTGKVPYYHAARVGNWIYFPFSDNADPTNVWVK